MKTITINIVNEEDKDLSDITKIISDDLSLKYYSYTSMYNLTSKYDISDEKHFEQTRICSQIVKLIKELEMISS